MEGRRTSAERHRTWPATSSWATSSPARWSSSDRTPPVPPIGTIVTSVPVMVTPTGIQDLAYTNLFPCGYSERMLLSSLLVLEVPNGLDPRHAALTEPMAVGLHAVNKSAIGAGRRRPRARLRAGGHRRHRRPPPARGRAHRRQRLLGHPPCVGGEDGRPRSRRPGRGAVVRGLGPPRRRPLARRLRGDRRARHHRRGPAVGPDPEPRRDRRCLHAAGRDHALLRHRQGAQPPVRARLRPARVRDQPARHRRGPSTSRR